MMPGRKRLTGTRLNMIMKTGRNITGQNLHQERKMKYLKIILTIIAVLLTLHLFKPIIPGIAKAESVTDVNIAQVAGTSVYVSSYGMEGVRGGIPVFVTYSSKQ